MLRNLGIRSKLLAVLCVPMAFLLAVSGVLVAQAAGNARRADRVQQLTTASTTLVGYAHQLQLERGYSEQQLATKDKNARARVQGQRQVVDAGLRQLDDTFASSPIRQVSPAMLNKVEQLHALDAKLSTVRKGVDSGALSLGDMEKYYDTSILAHLSLTSLLGDVVSDGSLARSLRNYTTISTLLEYAAQERDLLGLGAAAHHFTTAQHIAFIGVANQQDALFTALQGQVTGAQKRQLDKAITDGESSGYSDYRTTAEVTPAGKTFDVAPDLWDAESNDRINELSAVERTYGENVGAVAASIGAQARHQALLVGVLALIGVLIALGLVFFLARRITAPLRRLTTAAEDIQVALPKMVEQMQTPGEAAEVAVEPIAVSGSDEIGRLAEAFNAVNDVTVRVALEQAALRGSIAEMFVNVARRNQTLLGRQLSFLDQLEAREEDPDTLEDLFKLDHLAARMRRNAESLLVLAGIDATRRLRAPMALSDVVRTAVGEVENYERIDLAVDADPSVSGRVALSVGHLLAELIDNAAHFSNPDTRVEVALVSRPDGGVEVYITDSGLGMTHQELVAANARLASPPATEIAVAQRLGLYVVGRIAKRLGAQVTLHQRRSGGTSARVELPASVLAGVVAADRAPAESSMPAQLRADDLVTEESGTEKLGTDEAVAVEQGDAAPAEELGDAAPAAPTTTPSAPFLPAALAQDAAAGDDNGWQPAFAPDATPLTTRSAPLTSRRPGADPQPVEAAQQGADDPQPVEAQAQPVELAQPVEAAEPVEADLPVAPELATPDTSGEPAERPRGRRESFFRRRPMAHPGPVQSGPVQSGPVQQPEPVQHPQPVSPFALPAADLSIGLPALEPAPEPAPVAAAVAEQPGTDALPDVDTLSQLVAALTGPGAPAPAYEPVQEVTSLPVAHDVLPQRGRPARSARSFSMSRRRARGTEPSDQPVPAVEPDTQGAAYSAQPVVEAEHVATAGAPVGPLAVPTVPSGTPSPASVATPTAEPEPAGKTGGQVDGQDGQDGQGYSDDLAFRALAELSQLSAHYQPAYTPAGGLSRRQPRKTGAAPAAAAATERPSAARDANQVRGVLSGFRAGVQRGRANTPAENGGEPVGTTSHQEGQQ